MAVARVSRAERKAQTRSALLAAGRELFQREGFHGATLDRVAAEAGFTKGAVYASFPTKAGLFLAIFEERVEERCERFREIGERARDLADLSERMHREWARVLRDERAWSLLLVEFWVHAARDDALRERLRELHLRTRAAMAAATRRHDADAALDLDLEDFIMAQVAIGNGMNLEAFLEPRGVTAAYRRATDAFERGALR
jgi:AcrR family transcriptional regulator